MTKLEFLYQLEKHLKKLTNEEKKQTISYYSEMIDDMVESGLSEEEAINKLDNPKDIVRAYFYQEDDQIVKEEKINKNIVGKVFSLIGIIFSLIIIISIFSSFIGFGIGTIIIALIYMSKDLAKFCAFLGFSIASFGFAGIMYFVILIFKDIIKKILNKGGIENEKTPSYN